MRIEKKFRNLPLVIIGLLLLITFSCKKNSSQPGFIPTSDVDGNIYNTVTIGTQVWMVENLSTTRFQNGDTIPTVTDNTKWATLTNAAQCNYNNVPPYSNNYGRLYNWYAVNDPRNIAPPGWHVATYNDYMTLEAYVAAYPDPNLSIAQLLAAGIDWNQQTTSVGAVGSGLTLNNLSGFSALPGGYRFGTSGGFSTSLPPGQNGYWWCATEYNTTDGWSRSLTYNKSTFDKNNFKKTYGFSVRCVKD